MLDFLKTKSSLQIIKKPVKNTEDKKERKNEKNNKSN